MIETGLMKYWLAKYWPKTNKCTDPKTQKRQGVRSLTLRDMVSAFLVLALGIVLAAGAFLVEHLHAVVIRQRHQSRIPRSPKRTPARN